MKKWTIACLMLLVSATLGLSACGDGEDDEDAGQDTSVTQDAGDVAEDTGGDTAADTTADGGGMDDRCLSGEEPAEEDLRAFSGNLRFHPMTQALDEDATLAGAELALVAASGAVSGGELPAPLLDGQGEPVVESWGEDFMEATAEWSFEAVDVSSIALAIVSMVGHVCEQPDDPKFLNTSTGIASAPVEGDVSEAPLFAITMDTEAALVDLMAPKSDDISEAGDLADMGFVVLQFVDAEGNPVSGATVTKGSHDTGGDNCSENSGDRVANAFYPTSDWSEVNQGPCATTSDNGVAILPGVGLANYTGVQVENGTQFVSRQAAGNVSGVAFVGVRAPQQ